MEEKTFEVIAQNSRLRIGLFFLLALSTGCSLSANPNATIRLEIPPSDSQTPSINAGPITFLSAPATVDDMDCLSLNVMGPGIPEVSTLDHAAPYDFGTQFHNALNGDECASYFGALSGFTTVASGGNTQVTVPTGLKRLIQVLGMKTGKLGCPSSSYFDLE